MQYQLVGIVLILVWLTALSAVAIYIFVHIRRLSKDVGTGNLITVIKKLIQLEETNSESIITLEKEFKKLNEEGLSHIQKIGLVRFNPFEEMGGDHSFSLALLDGEDTGIILTGLHTRDRTRVYSKEIIESKTKYELSNEEQKALKKALKS